MIGKNKLIKSEQRIFESMPGFAVKERLAMRVPIEHLLRGINFHGSGYDDTSFYMNIFIMPLCIPTKDLAMNFGGRFTQRNGSDRWNIEIPNVVDIIVELLHERAMPFLTNIKTPLDFASLTLEFGSGWRTLEARAYALAQAGETDQAVETIDEMLLLEQDYEWHRELAGQVQSLRSLLLNDPQAANTRSRNGKRGRSIILALRTIDYALEEGRSQSRGRSALRLRTCRQMGGRLSRTRCDSSGAPAVLPPGPPPPREDKRFTHHVFVCNDKLSF